MNSKLTDNGPVHKMSDIIDTEIILGIDDLDEYVNNSSFWHIFYISIAFVVNADNIVDVIVFFWIKLNLIYLI